MNYRATQSDFSDLASHAQANKIRVLANEKRINVREECNRVCGSDEDELSRSGAQAFIDHLESLARGGMVAGKAVIQVAGTVCYLSTPKHRNLDVYAALMRLPQGRRRWDRERERWVLSTIDLHTIAAIACRHEQAEIYQDGVMQDLKNAATVPAIPDVRQP